MGPGRRAGVQPTRAAEWPHTLVRAEEAAFGSSEAAISIPEMTSLLGGGRQRGWQPPDSPPVRAATGPSRWSCDGPLATELARRAGPAHAAALTRLRPARFEAYSASSARAISSSGLSSGVHCAAPIETDTGKPW